MKFNHNEFLTYPNKFDQIFFARVKQARDMGAVAVGATIYFGSAESARQIVEVAQAFQVAHEMGLATVLWCYLRNPAFKTKEKDYHVSADLTGQANHLGVTLCVFVFCPCLTHYVFAHMMESHECRCMASSHRLV